MSLEEATWDSVNVIFAQLDLDVGPENVTQTAHEMGIEAPLQSVPAEAIGGLAIGVTPLEKADGYATLANGGIHHDPTAISRVEFPERQGRRNRHRIRRTGPHPGPGLRSDQAARGRDHPGHRRRLHLHRLLARRPARPAPPRASPTPGSSATRRSTRPRSGSGTRSRAKRPASVARPPARSGAPSWKRRRGRTAPNSKTPQACPNSRASTANTPARRLQASRRRNEYEEYERRRTEEERRTKRNRRTRSKKRRRMTQAPRPLAEDPSSIAVPHSDP